MATPTAADRSALGLPGTAPARRTRWGLSRQSHELRVGDETVICRGRGTAGYRGHRRRLSGADQPRLRFRGDGAAPAVERRVRQRRARASFRARGGERIAFPPGIPFHRLASMDDAWPYKGKTDYLSRRITAISSAATHLDAQQRPTFLYHYGEIAVEDFFEDLPDEDGDARIFKRTMTFDCAWREQPFYFRAASAKKITARPDRRFRRSMQLQLRITSEHRGSRARWRSRRSC